MMARRSTSPGRNRGAMLALLERGAMTGVELLRAGVVAPNQVADQLEREGWLIERKGSHPNALTTLYTLAGRQQQLDEPEPLDAARRCNCPRPDAAGDRCARCAAPL